MFLNRVVSLMPKQKVVAFLHLTLASTIDRPGSSYPNQRRLCPTVSEGLPFDICSYPTIASTINKPLSNRIKRDLQLAHPWYL